MRDEIDPVLVRVARANGIAREVPRDGRDLTIAERVDRGELRAVGRELRIAATVASEREDAENPASVGPAPRAASRGDERAEVEPVDPRIERA